MDRNVLHVVLPCYNEEENIRDLAEVWRSEEAELDRRGISLKLVLVNDGSSDHTLDIARYLESAYHNVTVLNHETNRGLGEAVSSGINYALSQEDSGLLCIMDSDMTHAPYYIHSMLDKLASDKLDCVIASRYRKGSRVEGLSLFRKLLSYGARAVYSITLGIPDVRDYTCGYRLYRLSALKALSARSGGKIIRERGFACMLELLAGLNRGNSKIGEVPFVLKYHLKGGQSKMKVMKTIYRSLAVLVKL